MRLTFTKTVFLNLGAIALATNEHCGYNEHEHLLGLGTFYVQDDNDNCYRVVFGEFIQQGHISSSETGNCDATVNFKYFVGAFDWDESTSTDKFEYRLGVDTHCSNNKHRRATIKVHEDESVSVPTFEVNEPSTCRYTFNIKIQSCDQPSINMVEEASVLEDEEVNIPIVVDGGYATNNVSISVTKEPEIGTVEVSGGRNLTYAANANRVGVDLFEYTVCDINAICQSANMTVTIVPIYGYEANVPEAEDYFLLYDLDIPNQPNWNTPNLPDYTYGTTPFKDHTRVAYWMELESEQNRRHEWVWVSMPKFEDDYRNIGIPVFATDFFYNGMQDGANVYTNKKDIATEGKLEDVTVNIEFWPTSYQRNNALNIPNALSDTFDFGDQRNTHGNYGSFQVHVPSKQTTLFALNYWGSPKNEPVDLGIGNQPSDNPDWTFSHNGDTYTLKNLAVLVKASPLDEADMAPTNLAAYLDDAQGYKMIYSLDIPDKPNFKISVPYSTDYSIFYPNGSFQRVAYYLELENDEVDEWVWVSMDTFTDDAKKLGVPTFASEAVFQEHVTQMNVYSNVMGMQAEGIGGGIEFWPYNYGTQDKLNMGASDKYWDYGDTMSNSGDYGSMQIYARFLGHGVNIISFNKWNSGTIADIGIGNNEDGNPDWTYAKNSNKYTVKKLEVFIK